MTNIVKVEHVEKYYGNKGNLAKALDDVSFTIDKGDFIGVMGPSGSGKTTLLNCIATIDQVTAGRIMINNQDLTKLKRSKLADFRRDEIGFVFQDFNLLDTLTGYENIAMALTIQNVPHRKIEEQVLDVSKKLGITDVLVKYPYQMSGGQQQRVACARALISNPSIILADEPTGALDSKSSRMLLESMQTMNNDLEATIMLVTHDALSASFCKRILFIKDGKIFTELIRGSESRSAFFDRIMDVLTLLGGDSADVL